jgi:hypothetical protein
MKQSVHEGIATGNRVNTQGEYVKLHRGNYGGPYISHGPLQAAGSAE